MATPKPKDYHLKWEDLDKPVKGLSTKKIHRLIVQREVVPIVFVPGIMGTRLVNSKSGKKVWDPDSSWFMLKTYAKYRPADRRRRMIGRRFDPEFLRVYDDDSKHNAAKLKNFPGAEKRGWGGVLWSSYGELLQHLARDHEWPRSVQHIFDLPVHACGYNWSDSNNRQGKKLKQQIDDIIAFYKKAGKRCEHVILVTHSMGGLVARSACKQGAESSVLGVLHGVQPVTGAPAAYWRMRAGFERPQKGGFADVLKGTIAAKILGTDGAEVTALLGNMPGGLQLLPNKVHLDNGGSHLWLRAENSRGKELFSFPRDKNPYKTIYKEYVGWWRLLDPYDLDPDATQQAMRASQSNKAAALKPVHLAVKRFEGYLREAETFHDGLGLTLHPNTFILWGKGKAHPTADRICLTFSPQAVWQGGNTLLAVGKLPDLLSADSLRFLPSDYFDNRGKYRTFVVNRDQVVYKMEMQLPSGAGDGTVPESSASVLARHGAKSQPVPGAEHEPAMRKPPLSKKLITSAIETMLEQLVDKRTKGKSP